MLMYVTPKAEFHGSHMSVFKSRAEFHSRTFKVSFAMYSKGKKESRGITGELAGVAAQVDLCGSPCVLIALIAW